MLLTPKNFSFHFFKKNNAYNYGYWKLLYCGILHHINISSIQCFFAILTVILDLLNHYYRRQKGLRCSKI